jgi:hypothetical protein
MSPLERSVTKRKDSFIPEDAVLTRGSDLNHHFMAILKDILL